VRTKKRSSNFKKERARTSRIKSESDSEVVDRFYRRACALGLSDEELFPVVQGVGAATKRSNKIALVPRTKDQLEQAIREELLRRLSQSPSFKAMSVDQRELALRFYAHGFNDHDEVVADLRRKFAKDLS
jgi:hypothetical protein